MCSSCNLIVCDPRCPYSNIETEQECCCECGNILEKGEEVYVNSENEAICEECFESMENKRIAEFFGLFKEVI